MFPRVWWASRVLSGFHLPWSGCLDRSSSFAALSREKLPKSAIPIPKKFSSGMCFVLSPPPGWCHGEGFHCKGRQGWWSWRAMHAGQSGWSAVEEKCFQSYSSFLRLLPWILGSCRWGFEANRDSTQCDAMCAGRKRQQRRSTQIRPISAPWYRKEVLLGANRIW